MVSIVDRTPYKIFGELREVKNVSYTVLKGLDKKLYLNWILVNKSRKPVSVGFKINPDTKAFKYNKKVKVKANGAMDHKLVVDVDKLSDDWRGVLVLSEDGNTKKIPLHFEKSVPVH